MLLDAHAGASGPYALGDKLSIIVGQAENSRRRAKIVSCKQK